MYGRIRKKHLSVLAATLAVFIIVPSASADQIVHDTKSEFETGAFMQTVLEGEEATPQIRLDSYSEFTWTFEDDDIAGWSFATKQPSAVAEENPAGQIHLYALQNAGAESYALAYRTDVTVTNDFVVEYLIKFDNIEPSGVADPMAEMPTGACARLDAFTSVVGFRMDIFTDRMVSFYREGTSGVDYPTISYFDVTTNLGQWYTLRFEGDFNDPELPVQVYRDAAWIGELKADTRNAWTSAIRPMAYSRVASSGVAEVHIDYVKLGTSNTVYYASGSYTSDVLDLEATSFGELSWTDITMSSVYPWGTWTKYSGNPVIDDGVGSGNLPENMLTDINDPLQQPITYDGKYWLSYAGCCGDDIRLAYSTDPDLLTWTIYESNPILAPDGGENYLFSPNLFKDGTTYYLFYDVSLFLNGQTAQRIAYATAPSPLGPWTKQQIILDVGPPGSWEEGRVTEPFVFKDGDTYYLFYMGDIFSSGNGEQIGLASTPAAQFPLGPEAGGHWTKHGLILPHNPDPAAWDRGLTADPSVVKVGDVFYMLYTGSYANTQWDLGIAWADNPLGPWNRPEAPNLVKGPSGTWDDARLVRGALHYNPNNDKWVMPYSGNDGSRYRGGIAYADPFAPEELITFETSTSPDGAAWEGWQPVLNGAAITSTPDHYFRYRATLNLGSYGFSPILTSVTVNYESAPAAGSISGDVFAGAAGLEGVGVGLYDGGGDPVQFVYTDPAGHYSMAAIPGGDYTLEVLVPLGFVPVSEASVAVTVAGGDQVIDFELAEGASGNVQSFWWWKAQFRYLQLGGVYEIITKVSSGDIEAYSQAIFDHFYCRTDGFAMQMESITYTDDPARALTYDELSAIFLAPYVPTCEHQVSRSIRTVLLNIASGRMSQLSVVSVDGATASQALTYLVGLYLSGDPTGEYIANVNLQRMHLSIMIPAGIIPLDVPNIMYKPEDLARLLPEDFSLAQNFPNPFNPNTIISFRLPHEADVSLDVYNIMGQVVTTLIDRRLGRGEHVVTWNGTDSQHNRVATGIYFYQLRADGFVETRKMVMLK
ncbi:MAG: T9SS type A sorting domain-containing protein [Candidatus Zixiibacteriota bacterium]|nr:MAG: T9SS type A sorting domain-containing protein [candidate division Zixibacteria bacterium]